VPNLIFGHRGYVEQPPTSWAASRLKGSSE